MNLYMGSHITRKLEGIGEKMDGLEDLTFEKLELAKSVSLEQEMSLTRSLDTSLTWILFMNLFTIPWIPFKNEMFCK